MTDNGTRRVHRGVLALAVTSFAIGVAEFVVVGILPAIADDLKVSLDRAGGLVGLYALALAVGTPLVVLTLARFPRKPVLLALVAVFLAGNLLSAMSVDYASLLIGRIVTAVAHGSFFAIGATVAAALAPRGQASRAIAIMFSGLTLAMVIGVPLGSVLGNGLGWRLPFFAVAGLAALALMATAWWLPPMPAPRVGRISTQLAALGQPSILAMMLVTILGFGSSFAAFTFITPILTGMTGFSPTMAGVLLVVFGAATLVGNLAGGRFAASLGWRPALRLLFALLGMVLAVIGLVLSHPLPMVVMLFAWGVLAFGMSPGVQAAMLETAERDAPQAVDFASGLNISSFNLGISLGETVGGMLVAHGHLGLTPWAGVIGVVAAQAPLAWIGGRARRAQGIADPA
ncbi:MFS transporter [Gluconacetobacter tumulisoli]|uniref:MFS transporter n=1 Tax=Gluconacetobacter tumulisoli TaxID=1286189 RepID=A0A7W4K6C0_9PROT|nr:MFS transporter [Gluconacetobacter tumulisoli]MBB2201077.1 MFS transporter [Gluconacetobacter tumulisoli]